MAQWWSIQLDREGPGRLCYPLARHLSSVFSIHFKGSQGFIIMMDFCP